MVYLADDRRSTAALLVTLSECLGCNDGAGLGALDVLDVLAVVVREDECI